ncbi:MAG: response regulator transcription factor [Rhizobiaceae bacterium]|nr:response regulator transcription factor [Rhizobiaceae bacterium]
MCLHIVVKDLGLRDALMVLLRMHGFAVLPHADARSFRRSVIAADDTVIVDLDLPHGQATGLIDWCRRNSVAARLIVLTGLTGRAMDVRLREMGSAAILTKPFQAAELLALL